MNWSDKMVKIKILKEEDNKIQILLSKTDRSFANALRRSLISDTQKWLLTASDSSLVQRSKMRRYGRLLVQFPTKWSLRGLR